MKQIILNVKDEKVSFFLDLIKHFNFVQVEDDVDTKKEILPSLPRSFKDGKLAKEGKLKTTSAKDFLDEL